MGKFKLPENLKISLPSFARQHKLALGLDIGSYSVKVCEIIPTSANGHQVIKTGSAKLPDGAVEDGVLQNPEAVAAIIDTLCKNLRIKQKKVAISMSGYSVIVKKINLAVMEDKELAEHIKSEAEQYIPFDINDVYLDYQDLKTNTENSEFTDIMLVAAKKDVINAYLEMLTGIGLQTVVVDVDAFALENSFEDQISGGQNFILIDIGASKISINIIAHGASILARDVVMGSRQITEQIQEKLGIEAEEAENLKIGGKKAEEEEKKAVEEIVVNNCSQWILEIKKAIDFYASNYPEDKISRIILSGGGSKIKGLDKFLNKELNMETEIFNPFAKTEVSDKIDRDYLAHIAPEMAIAAGLALRPVTL
ncbi:type IV pilus biogenesis protein PilM [Desulfobacterota bacterium M19]